MVRDPLEDVGRYWCAGRFGSDDAALLAFNAVHDDVPFIGAWRTRHPKEQPHTDFCVFVVGEDEENVERARQILTVHGAEPWTPEPGFVDALRERRRAQVIEAAARGGPMKLHRHFPDGATMDHGGRMSNRGIDGGGSGSA